MTPSLPFLAEAAREALMVAVWVSLPLVAVAALVGLVVSVIQAVMQLQDSTLSHLPRLLAVAITLAALGPWMGRQIAAFAVRLLAGV
jgi:type III secretion HrpO family protein